MDPSAKTLKGKIRAAENNRRTCQRHASVVRETTRSAKKQQEKFNVDPKTTNQQCLQDGTCRRSDAGYCRRNSSVCLFVTLEHFQISSGSGG